jgi:hypothetical protein
MDLREYEEIKFALAALLRSADARDPHGRHAHEDVVRDLFSRLAEDRFNLVVVGRFSRGKTSLMNAVLATDRLPTGIRPLTSVITTVTYGSEEKAVIHYQNSRLPEDIPLAALPQYVAEQGNSANHRRVSDAAMLAASGIAAFAEALIGFLVNDKSREFLLRMCQRIGGFFAELPRRSEVARLGEQLAALARRIDAVRGGAMPAMAAEPSIGPIRPCRICAHVSREHYDFLRTYQYDIIVVPGRQRELAERGGLCSIHIWGYEAAASPHGTRAGFAAVLDRLAARLLSAPGGSVPEPACIVCEARAAAEAAAVAAIVTGLRQNLEDALRSLGDLCMPHFRLLAAAIADPDIAARLFAREAALLQRVAEDMRRFALKHEGVRRYLASEETKAAQRALSLLGGHRTLNTPGPQS